MESALKGNNVHQLFGVQKRKPCISLANQSPRYFRNDVESKAVNRMNFVNLFSEMKESAW